MCTHACMFIELAIIRSCFRPKQEQLCFAMPLVSQYAHLRKANYVDGASCQMFPLRAVGLACERGHRLSAESGLGRLTPAALADLPLSGALQVQERGTWRAARSCTLRLRPEDSKLAWTMVRQQREYLSELALNCWAVDLRMGLGAPSYDLAGDFSLDNEWGVTGRVWVETKVVAARGFDQKFVQYQQELQEKFAEAQATDASLDAVLLLCARCGGGGRAWQKPKVIGKLFCSVGPFAGTWVDPLPGYRRGSSRGPRGRCQAAKPPLSALLAQMEWIPNPRGSGPCVGLLKHFLDLLNLPTENVRKRATSFNKRLQDAGSRVPQLAPIILRDRGGRAAWAAPKGTFRKVYDLV